VDQAIDTLELAVVHDGSQGHLLQGGIADLEVGGLLRQRINRLPGLGGSSLMDFRPDRWD
jgi:hypothetical protein